jgi:cell division protein FtsI/penicillin-binding protein 2
MLLDAIPEKQPALLSLLYVGGFALTALLLGLTLLLRSRRRSALSNVAPADLPTEVRKRLGVTSTNRGLQAIRIVFILLALTVYGFHVYWARYAKAENERFQDLSYKDLRNRRLSESTLRGWIFDRTGSLDRALALYRSTGDGQLQREYPLDREVAQLLGTDRGTAGLERALFGIDSWDAPEALDLALGEGVRQPGNLDVRLTIDSELQKAAAKELGAAIEAARTKHRDKQAGGAVVILNPQTGEILALYSEPSYSLSEAQDLQAWERLDNNKRDQPLVSRATRTFYTPGSTFKTVVMIAAFMSGMEDTVLSGSPGGYVAEPGAKTITDDNGSCEICGPMNMDQAYMISSNQYFAQLAVKLGPQRMEQAAKLLGIGAYHTPEEALVARPQTDILNVSRPGIARAIAPFQATMVTAPKMRRYDLALEGHGQGMAGQMTTFQMAMVASAVANLQGKLMKPKIEYDVPPVAFSQPLKPEQAAEARRIMGLVTGGPSGTARGVFGPVHASGIITGGKTGTAQKDVPLYDPKTGEVMTDRREDKDRHGNVIRVREVPLIDPEKRIDSWFLCIAPLDNPQIAMAVIIEGGGYGSKAAAPVAAALVMKARELGLLGLPPVAAPQPQPGGQRPAQSQPARPPKKPTANAHR